MERSVRVGAMFVRAYMAPLFTSILCFMLAVCPAEVAFAQSSVIATPVPNATQVYLDANGKPLAGGKVYSYVPNTSTAKTTWSDTGETLPNTNPVTLDSAGRGIIFGQGNYRQKVTDSLGNVQWDGFTLAPGSSAPSGSQGSDTAPVGTIIAWAGFAVPTNWLLAYGQTLNRADYPDLLTALTITDTSVLCTSGSQTLTGWADTSQMRVGAPVEASCLPTGTTISTINSATTITVSNNATATSTVTATVFPWGNGDGTLTFTVPDLRGRTFAGADAMGGTAASRLTSTYYGASASPPGVAGGSQSRTLATANLPPYTPAGTISVSPNSNIAVWDGGTIVANVTSGSPNAPSSASLTQHTMTATLTGTAQGGTSTPFAGIQPTVTINYIIKAKPNSSGLGGVVSFGGLFGDIDVDSTLRTYTDVNGVNWAGLATQSNNTMLANVSGGSAAATPTSMSSWLDSACGSTAGSLVYRNATNWACLGPGVSDAILKLDANKLPFWGTISVVGSVDIMALPNIP